MIQESVRAPVKCSGKACRRGTLALLQKDVDNVPLWFQSGSVCFLHCVEDLPDILLNTGFALRPP